jgi:APA family basic amino acid/polyamine antiporter
VHDRTGVPHVAELSLGGVVVVLVLLADLRGAIGFSSFCVLGYYALANASAFTLEPAERRWPRAVPVLGVAGCAALALSLPWTTVVTGVLLLVAAMLLRAVARARTGGDPPEPSG